MGPNRYVSRARRRWETLRFYCGWWGCTTREGVPMDRVLIAEGLDLAEADSKSKNRKGDRTYTVYLFKRRGISVVIVR